LRADIRECRGLQVGGADPFMSGLWGGSIGRGRCGFRGRGGGSPSGPADGTVTLTAVAWDSIQKIVVRQVEGLPDGMFE